MNENGIVDFCQKYYLQSICMFLMELCLCCCRLPFLWPTNKHLSLYIGIWICVYANIVYELDLCVFYFTKKVFQASVNGKPTYVCAESLRPMITLRSLAHQRVVTHRGLVTPYGDTKLTAPSHYLNQCWFINKVQLQSSVGNFTSDASAINH